MFENDVHAWLTVGVGLLNSIPHDRSTYDECMLAGGSQRVAHGSWQSLVILF